MDFKHFTHHHNLTFHHVPPSHDIQCSGCKNPGSGNIYACWQCSYFLHDQCFRAARSLRHHTHPSHPLTLVPYPTYPSGSFICNSCNLGGKGLSYSCSECEFDIHVHCAYNTLSTPSYPPPFQNAMYPPQPVNVPQPYSPQPGPALNNPQVYPPQPGPALNTPQVVYPPQPSPAQNNPQVYPPQPQPPQGYPSAQTNPSPTPTQPTDSTVVHTTTPNVPPTQPPTNTVQTNQTNPSPSIIKHFSHPHVLKAVEVDQKDGKICSGCECYLKGSSYLCTESQCKFCLHKACFDSPLELKHGSHLQHPLKLVTSPPYAEGFTCNACLKDGKAFAYTCATCGYDLHIDCVQWPETVTRSDHKHPMKLYYSSAGGQASQDAAFMCDVCKNPVHEMAWMYLCRECDFGTHLECIATGIGGGGGNGGQAQEDLLTETELRFAMLQLLLQTQALGLIG